MGVGGPREAFSFNGAEIAAKTTTGDMIKYIHLQMCNETEAAPPWGEMARGAFSPKSFTMVASDCRGTTLLLGGVFVALGSRIIPEDADIRQKSFITDQCRIPDPTPPPPPPEHLSAALIFK